MRLTMTEKKIVKRLTEHAIELVEQDRIVYHRGKKKEESKALKKSLASILAKVTKDIEQEENKEDK